MKKLVVLLMIVFYSSTFSQVDSTQTNQTDFLSSKSKDGFKLIGGVGIGVGSGSFTYLKVSNQAQTQSSTSSGASQDILNEYKVLLNAKFNSWFGFGTEVGRLTYHQMSDSESGGIGQDRIEISEFMSGVYASPYIILGNFNLGFTYMSPTSSTYFARTNDNLASDINYDDLTSASQKLIDDATQPYLNVYVSYTGSIEKSYGIPLNLFAKLGYDLQNPFNYEKRNVVVDQNIRVFLTVGVTYNMDLIK